VLPVRCELNFHIPEDGILHSRRREILKCYIAPFSFLNVQHQVSSKRNFLFGLVFESEDGSEVFL
jgi:hypothetical protein